MKWANSLISKCSGIGAFTYCETIRTVLWRIRFGNRLICRHSDHLEITTTVVVSCGGRGKSSRNRYGVIILQHLGICDCWVPTFSGNVQPVAWGIGGGRSSTYSHDTLKWTELVVLSLWMLYFQKISFHII